MVFSNIDRKSLTGFLIFVFAFELFHIQINDAPPMALRMAYIGIYLLFCIMNIRLIPIFTTVNLIVERFSTVYGEFLPNTLYFHIAILFMCYLQLRKNSGSYLIYYNKTELTSLIIFGLYALVSAIFYGIFSTVNSILFALLFMATLTLSHKEHIKALINCIIITMTISCLFSFINYENLAVQYLTSSGGVQRLAWKDSNYLSFFIGLVTLLALFKAKHSTKRKDINFYLIITIILLICLTMLISRGAIVALAVACAFYYKRQIFSHKIFGYAIVIVIVGYVFYNLGLFDGFIMRFESKDLETGSGRTEIWETGFKTFFGKGNLTILFGAGDNQAANMAYRGGIFYSPHNNFIEVLFNFGIVGLILFLSWWGSMFFNSKSLEKTALIIFILTNSMTIVPLSFVMPVWIIIPLILIWDKYINKIIYE